MEKQNRRFRYGRAFVLFLTLYCIVVWYCTEYSSDWGEVTRQWWDEYHDDQGRPSGSMKFRGSQGMLYQYVAMPFAILVYPAAAMAAISLLLLAMKEASPGMRVAQLLAMVAMMAILIRFAYLGVFTTAWSSL